MSWDHSLSLIRCSKNPLDIGVCTVHPGCHKSYFDNFKILKKFTFKGHIKTPILRQTGRILQNVFLPWTKNEIMGGAMGEKNLDLL